MKRMTLSKIYINKFIPLIVISLITLLLTLFFGEAIIINNIHSHIEDRVYSSIQSVIAEEYTSKLKFPFTEKIDIYNIEKENIFSEGLLNQYKNKLSGFIVDKSQKKINLHYNTYTSEKIVAFKIEDKLVLVHIDFSYFKKLSIYFSLIVLISYFTIIIIWFINVRKILKKSSKPFSNLIEKIANFAHDKNKMPYDDYFDKCEIQEVYELYTSFCKMAEEIWASFSELEAINSELEYSYNTQNEMTNKLEEMISLSSRLINESVRNDESFLNDILEIAMRLIPEADCGSISIIEGEKWRFINAKGHDIEKLKNLELKKEYIFNPMAKPKEKEDISNDNQAIMPKELYDKFCLATIPVKKSLIVGLFIADEHIGNLALDISKKKDGDFNPISKQILESFANYASAFFAIKKLMKMQGKFQKDLILSMIGILELYDSYTKGHSENVAKLSAELAEEMGYTKSDIQKVYWAGLVHDIGKIMVPTSILNKPDRLTDKEFDTIKMHPLWGYSVLLKSEELKTIAIYVRHHHERWDGKGYPDGLKGENIPLFSRIITIADAYDAMVDDRAYRKKMDKDLAKNELISNKGKQFDPAMVDVFVRLVDNV